MTLRRIVLAVLLVLAVGVALGAYLAYRSRDSSPVAEQSALARYRAVQGSVQAVGAPAPGVYIYAVSGWECAGVGPLCLHRSLPDRAYAVVTRRGDLLTVELELSREHLEAQRFRLVPRGSLLVWRRTRLAILGVSQDDAHAITPPTTLAVPRRLRPGSRWSQRFHDGGLPVAVENRITGRRTLTLGDGSRLATFEVERRSKTGGAHPGTEVDVAWRSQALQLDARMSIVRHIKGVFPYRLEATATLLSTHPRQ
jgi:hypothetical protein